MSEPLRSLAGLVPGTFLALLTDDERELILSLGVRQEFPTAATLMFQREPDERVMFVLQGRVKVARIDQDGHEVLLSIRDPGDVLGELAFIDGQPRIATVTALEPVQAVLAPSQAFRTHLETTPRVAVALLEVVARRYRETTLKRSQFGASDTMGRLAGRILELAERYGEARDDAVQVDSPLSQEELAAWTGSSRAGVAQALQAMRELGWIRTERRKVIVFDAEAMRGRAM